MDYLMTTSGKYDVTVLLFIYSKVSRDNVLRIVLVRENKKKQMYWKNVYNI